MGGRDTSIIASSYMQIFLSFDFIEIASWNMERNILISKNLTVSRLVASINSGLPYINPNHAKVRFSRPEKWYHRNSYASRSEHRAAESSETKYTENLSTKELLEQRRQVTLQYSRITAFSAVCKKKKKETRPWAGMLPEKIETPRRRESVKKCDLVTREI